MSTPASNKPPRLLIVDDEAFNIQILAEALPGFDVCFATNGPRALGMALEQSIDLILLDVVMPGMDGFEVLRWLKSEPRTQHIPVIFVTAMSEMENEELGFALGAVDYIAKPICPAIVRARVRIHIELKRQRDLLEEHVGLDTLTGLHNRRRFDQELQRAWRNAQQAGSALCLIRVAVDHFKAFSDHYGHSPANECLQRVAQALAAEFSGDDEILARYRDQEFALLLPSGEPQTQLRRVLGCVAALEIPHVRSASSIFVTVCAGAVLVSARPDGNTETAVAAAEAMLELARSKGGNRAEIEDQLRGESFSIDREAAA